MGSRLMTETIPRFVIFFLWTAVTLHAYREWNLPGLTAPTTLKAPSIEATYQHQFRGNISGQDRPSNMFGLGEGAAAFIGLRAVIWRSAQAYFSYDTWQLAARSHNEFTAGTAFAVMIPKLLLRLQANGEVYTHLSTAAYPEKRVTAFFISGSLRNQPLFDRVAALCNVGYDTRRNAPGLGFGLDVKVAEPVDLYGLYIPVLHRPDTAAGEPALFNPFLFGVKITTYGHQFMIFAGNMIETGVRNPLFGTVDNHLRFGFMLQRLFTW